MAGHEGRERGRGRADALLEAANAEGGRARLKIFFGAAPGVGKTFAMLSAAQARRREGVDVVVGVVETHGRAETAALVEGLETIPRRTIDYKGQALTEMDLEAILARRPALALVDELAHGNVAGSRHPKRYLDVEDLLANGVDVYATLNIQHVESLNDVVAQITRIRVRETVPDRIIDRADEIEMVDLTPDDLIRRLKDGKVYVPKSAERALGHYFSKGNLTALRELALRRTAQRVDDQLLSHMRANAIAGPWAAGERVLVCIDEDPRSDALVRYAKRLADLLHAPWTALSIESRRQSRLTEAQRDAVAQTMRLAQHLGGDTFAAPSVGGRIADDVIDWAHENNATHIVVGKASRSRLFEALHGSVAHEIVARSGDIVVHVVAGGAAPGDGASAPFTAGVGAGAEKAGFAWAGVATALALGLNHLMQPLVGLESVPLVFLTAIVGVAVRYGLWPSMLAVGLASLAYNFFFLPPLYTFVIADPANVAALFLFGLVAVLVSNLAARARHQAAALQTRVRTTEALYSFSRKLAACANLDDVLWATVYQFAMMLRRRVVVLLPGAGGLHVRAGHPPEDRLDDADLAAARWAFEHETPAGRGADTLPGGKRLFLPMRTGRGVIGVVGLDDDSAGPLLTPEQRRLFDALSDQGALAIERVGLVEDLDQAKRASEADRLRQALLTSISHDLKTPLAAVIGAASALRDLHEELDPRSRAELLDSVLSESERLDRFIANLLDMTRLEAGGLAPNLALQDIGEVLGATLNRAAKLLAGHRVELALADDLPMVRIDAVLFEHVLFNLLDNAAKYAGETSTIRIQSWREGASAKLRVLDEGAGVPSEDLARIFDKFYRVRKGDSVRAGTGLGLSIARGFVEAMGGSLTAANREDRSGAMFTLTLPIAADARPASVEADQTVDAAP